MASNQNPLVYLTRVMWRFSGDNRPEVVRYGIMFVIANVISALDPVVIGIFFNAIQKQGVTRENLGYLILLLGVFLVKELVFWMFHGTSRVKELRNAFIVRRNYKEYLLRGTMAFPIEWHADHHSGDTIDKIEKGSQSIGKFTEKTFIVLQGIVGLIVAFVALFYFDWVTALIVTVLTVISLWIVFAFDQKLILGYRMVNRMENQTSARVFDVLSNITTVVILRIETQVLKSIKQAIGKPFEQYVKNVTMNEWKWFSASIMGRLIVFVVIAYYLVHSIAAGGVILIGTIYILYQYSDRIRETFFQFASLYNDIVSYRTSVANAEEISSQFPTVIESDAEHLPRNWRELSISSLSFSYHGNDSSDLHLSDVSLVIGRGQRIALIGESGGGKSTFLKLVRDLYHSKTLNLSVDGQSIPSFKAISESISLVPQDPEIFATTIRENITLGVEYSDAEVQTYTDLARFSDVVTRLPKGLESSIVEKGVNLSGGEKQRLALSRGLLASADKDIILLDEPTSSVDTANELEIYKNIFDAFPDKAILSSIHRLHLLPLFDQVYFFVGGKIIASGTFDELSKTSPEFQQLWEKYRNAYNDGSEDSISE